jgi:hypothetical protein
MCWMSIRPLSIGSGFRSRCGEPGSLLDVDASAAALAELTEALTLWRGPALCDMSSRLLQETEAPRMTTAQVEAEKLRIELAMRLDRYEAVRPWLAALTGEFPLDEDFYRLGMLAECRAGRRAAAPRGLSAGQRGAAR